ncbi:hypothetical protein ABPG75_000682 [Micractinium tetrahymenae]
MSEATAGDVWATVAAALASASKGPSSSAATAGDDVRGAASEGPGSGAAIASGTMAAAAACAPLLLHKPSGTSLPLPLPLQQQMVRAAAGGFTQLANLLATPLPVVPQPEAEAEAALGAAAHDWAWQNRRRVLVAAEAALRLLAARAPPSCNPSDDLPAPLFAMPSRLGGAARNLLMAVQGRTLQPGWSTEKAVQALSALIHPAASTLKLVRQLLCDASHLPGQPSEDRPPLQPAPAGSGRLVALEDAAYVLQDPLNVGLCLARVAALCSRTLRMQGLLDEGSARRVSAVGLLALGASEALAAAAHQRHSQGALDAVALAPEGGLHRLPALALAYLVANGARLPLGRVAAALDSALSATLEAAIRLEAAQLLAAAQAGMAAGARSPALQREREQLHEARALALLRCANIACAVAGHRAACPRLAAELAAVA